MFSTPTAPTDLPELKPGDFYRLTLDQYHEMVRAGVLADDAPVELLDGWLITKVSRNPPQAIATERPWKVLFRLLPPGWDVMAQQPVTLETSEPEPDAAIIRGSRDDYPDRHPGPADVALVVEVADASLDRDRSWKRRLYAGSGIPVYWIVNLIERRVEVYSDPLASATGEPDYASLLVYAEDGDVPLLLDGREVARIRARDLLPPGS